MGRNDAYELELTRLLSLGSLRSFTDEENIQINEDLNQGMESFLYEQKNRDKVSEMELAGIVLNA